MATSDIVIEMSTLVNQDKLNTIKFAMRWKKYWGVMANACYLGAKILTLSGGILIFVSDHLENSGLAIASGAIVIGGNLSISLGDFCKKQSNDKEAIIKELILNSGSVERAY